MGYFCLCLFDPCICYLILLYFGPKTLCGVHRAHLCGVHTAHCVVSTQRTVWCPHSTLCGVHTVWCPCDGDFVLIYVCLCVFLLMSAIFTKRCVWQFRTRWSDSQAGISILDPFREKKVVDWCPHCVVSTRWRFCVNLYVFCMCLLMSSIFTKRCVS